MAKRSKKTDSPSQGKHRRNTPSEPHSSEDPGTLFDPSNALNMEREMANLSKLLSEQEFESIDEANEFLENLLSSTGGRLPSREPETPEEEAMELLYQAYEARPRKALTLAKKALKLWPDCADAYLLLADLDAADLEERLAYHQKALAAGERAIGPETFTEARGHFWGLVETRPYMRAREQLAETLWHLGRPEEALAHLQEMLELNPHDNQGMRYTLLTNLMLLRRDDQAQELWQKYEEDASAHWLYNHTLLIFRREGRSQAAQDALQAAVDFNEFVGDYLTGTEPMPHPDEIPGYIQIGDETEAVDYAVNAVLLWAQTPGASLWLMENLE